MELVDENLWHGAPLAAFHHFGHAFLLDINQLILDGGYSQGLHYLKVRAGDLENNVTDIAQIPVIFDCDDDRDRPGWGDIYTPAHMERVAGVVEVTVSGTAHGILIGTATDVSVPSGVWTLTLARRLVTTWVRRSSSPCTITTSGASTVTGRCGSIAA